MRFVKVVFSVSRSNEKKSKIFSTKGLVSSNFVNCGMSVAQAFIAGFTNILPHYYRDWETDRKSVV